jgi:uncharacterized protein YecE (DUF72 family)
MGFMARRGRTWIGTSGWQYDHWTGPVYEKGLDTAGRLARYAKDLGSVEVNSTFYGLPSDESVETWYEATPGDFLFAVKASRYITHMKKLKEPRQSIERFFKAIEPLGDKLGPILFQLPPHWHVNAPRLKQFLEALPQGYRYTFEFRDESWHCAEIMGILARHDAAFCIFDIEGNLSPTEVTTDFTYIRLHGPDGAYQGSYSQQTLSGWSGQISRWLDDEIDCYCYFDNDQAGYAFANAVSLQKMVPD